MPMKKTSLTVLLALGVAFTQTMALADTGEVTDREVVSTEGSPAFQGTFQTVASYVTESPEGYLSVEMPTEVLETLDQAVYADLLATLALHNAEVASSGAAEQQDQLRIPFAKKLIIIGLKHGGPVVKKIVSKVSPKAGKWIGKYADKLARFLEDLENWAELPIITYLVKNGVPPADAKIMAEIIVALL
jgi:hypothetical protein